MIERRQVLLGLSASSLAATGMASADEAAPHVHRLAIQVSENRPELMTMALNNAVNVSRAYSAKGEDVSIEIVAYGPGLHMLRQDTSPVKERIATFPKSMPNVSFSACQNTIDGMAHAEGKPVVLIPETKTVEAGVVRLMELQEQGWSYIKV